MASAAARPQVSVFGKDGASTGENLPLPLVFTAPMRTDIVRFVTMNIQRNRRQGHAVNVDAGMQHSAESWGTGRAVSRIPRVSGSGTHAASSGAFGNMCRGGRMFGPKKIWRRFHRKMPKGQRRYAVCSAIAASAVPALVMARGHRVDGAPEIPLIVDDSAESIKKTSDAYKVLKALGVAADVDKAAGSKKVRAGKGKMRNRRYVMRRGPLFVYASNSSAERAFRNLPGVEVAHVDRLNLLQLAPGGHLGRLVIWSKSAFQRLDTLYGTFTETSSAKAGFSLPDHIMANADLARVINSDEIQSIVRPAKDNVRNFVLKRNPLKNRDAMVKLNPYHAVIAEAEAKQRAASAKRKASGGAKESQKRRRAEHKANLAEGRKFYAGLLK